MEAEGQPNESRRRTRGLGIVDSLTQDLRFSARALGRRVGFAAAVILTLAIGICGVTAVFGIVHSVLLAPLPYADPDRLVVIWRDDDLSGRRRPIATAEVQALREAAGAFERIGAYDARLFAWKEDESIEAESLRSVSVDAEMLSVLGFGKPGLGRGFVAEEYRPEPSVAILGHGLWASRFGSDPDILGRSLRLSAGSESLVVTVVGVMPEDFRFNALEVGMDAANAYEPQLFLPSAPDAGGIETVTAVARLKAGASIEAAQADLDRVAAGLRQERPEIGERRYRAVPFKSEVIDSAQPVVLLLFAAVAVVLLIAVANVANLQLVRAVGREAEIALRLAVGSSVRRLTRMFVTESLMLSFAGALAGIVLARIATRSLIGGLPAWPRLEEAGIGAPVAAFAAGLAIATGVVFGLAPAAHTRRNIDRALRERARGSTEGGRTLRSRELLVAVQIALAVTLLAAASLVAQSFLALAHQDLGMDPENLLYADVRIDLPASNAAQNVQFYAEVVRRLEQLPAVEAASYGTFLTRPFATVTAEDTMEAKEGPGYYAEVARDYFQTLEVSVESGRFFAEAAADEVLINESMARRFWPGSDPVEKRFLFGTAPGPDNPWLTVAGVVSDFKTSPFTGDPPPTVYGLCEHSPTAVTFGCDRTTVVVRARSDPAKLAANLRSAIAGISREVTLSNLQTSAQAFDRSVGAQRFTMAVLGTFAGVALMLAFVGVYSVTSYAAARRVREVGVQIALGATRADIARALLRQALTPVVLGCATGLVGAVAVTRLLLANFHELQAGSPWVLSAIPLIVAGIALLAGSIPSLRASAADPTLALRPD